MKKKIDITKEICGLLLSPDGDPDGSYTGTVDGDKQAIPVQDADDL